MFFFFFQDLFQTKVHEVDRASIEIDHGGLGNIQKCDWQVSRQS